MGISLLNGNHRAPLDATFDEVVKNALVAHRGDIDTGLAEFASVGFTFVPQDIGFIEFYENDPYVWAPVASKMVTLPVGAGTALVIAGAVVAGSAVVPGGVVSGRVLAGDVTVALVEGGAAVSPPAHAAVTLATAPSSTSHALRARRLVIP